MKRVFGYVRVSTTKQAEKGVSLKEQRRAITAYAAKNDLTITRWFEEHVTAAKRGRPQFLEMLRALRWGKADGVVIHKIDRSARNLGDWSDLGELIDAGFDIHLAHEPLDLRTRGGRLSADILAVVAADFVRNNKQEAKKGFDGRLRDGIYPLAAPVGYLDRGKGGPAHQIDPKRAPLVRYAFERYGQGGVSLHDLLRDLTAKGLRNRKGRPFSLTGLVTMLRNSFYAGVIRLKKTKATFRGIHEPIIRVRTFERVQAVLEGKRPRRTRVHDYRYRRLFTCGTCGRALIGSVAKGRVYYRCQVMSCPTTSVREDALDEAVRSVLRSMTLPDAAIADCKAAIEAAESETRQREEASRAQLNGHLGDIAARLKRLTDVYLEGGIDKDAHDERRAALILDRQKIADALEDLDGERSRAADFLMHCLELARRPEMLYEKATAEEKRDLLKIVTSNRTVSGKKIEIAMAEPFCFLPSARETTSSALDGVATRTASSVSKALLAWAATQAPDLDVATTMETIDRLVA